MSLFSFQSDASENDPAETNAELQHQMTSDENERLKMENLKLRQQFEQAINIRKDLDKLHSENLQLTNKLRMTELAKEDIERKMRLNIASYKEQVEKASQDASTKLNNAQQEINSLQDQINFLTGKNNYNQKDTECKIQEALYIAEAESKKCEVLQNKLKLITEKCGTYLHIQFTSPETMLAYFDANSIHSVLGSPSFKNNNHISINGKLIRRLTNKFHKEQTKRKAVQTELSAAYLKIQNIQSDYENQLNIAKRELKEKSDKLQRQEIFHNQVVQQLENNLIKSREENQKKIEPFFQLLSHEQQRLSKSQTLVNNDENKDKKEFDKLKKNSESCIKRIRERNSNLQKQLAHAIKEKDVFEEELRVLKAAHADLQNSNSICKKEFEIQLKQNMFLENERKAIQEELVKITTQTDKEESEKVVEMQRKIDEFEELFDKAEKENIFLQNQIKQTKDQISNLTKIVQTKTTEFDLLQSSFSDLKDENQSLVKKINSIPPPLDIDEILPKSSLTCHNAPTELANSLNDLKMNDSIPLATKVSTAIFLVQSFYSKLIDSEQNDNKMIKDENNHLKQIINKYLTIFGQMIKDEKILEKDDTYILKIITEFQQNYQKIESDKEIFNQIMKDIIRKLDLPEEGISAQSFNQIIDQFIELKNHFNTLNSELKASKKQKRLISEKSYKEIKILQQQVQDVQKINKILETDLNSKTQKLHELELTNQSLTFNINNAEESIKELNQAQEKYIMQIREQASNECENYKSSFNNEILDKNNLIEKLRKKIDLSEKSNSLLRKGVCVLKKKLAQSVGVISNLKKSFEKEKQGIILKYEEERNSFQKINDDTVSKLREQCSELRESMAKINESLKNSESKNSKMLREISIYKRNKQKIEDQLEAQHDSLAREKKIMETQIHAAVLNAETKANSLVSNLKSTLQSEKQKLIAYFAEQFRAFFDPNEQIDTNMYQKLVERAKNELIKLQSSDNAIRRLTNAMPGQPTEDAVAQFVFKNK